MAASVQTLQIRHTNPAQGVTMVSCYFAGADAVGYIVPVLLGGAAAATSPTEFRIPAQGVIEFISGPATGTLQLWVNGQPTPIFLNTATIISQAAVSNKNYGLLAGGAQRAYQLRVAVAMAA